MTEKAKVLVRRGLTLSGDGRYHAEIVVLAVTKSERFPTGIKAKFVLLDTYNQIAALLVDNHEPYGFHIHSKLPNDPKHRVKLATNGHREALHIFFAEAERIIHNEET